MKKKIVIAAISIAAVGGAAGAYQHSHRDEVTVTTEPITRGDIVQVVKANGTLEAVRTVKVGSQVTGIIEEIAADFNSVVRKGQLIARLDSSTFDAQVEQARAGLARAQAEVDRVAVTVQDAAARQARSRQLFARHLVAEADWDAAHLAALDADAQLRAAQAHVKEARAVLDQSLVNVEHTNIYSPVDGIVVARNVDIGETVVANLEVASLFSIAEDLSTMQVKTGVDEADVSLVHEGQVVRLKVDAYPDDAFSGNVAQVRLQPTTSQNVVTYTAIVKVRNDDFRLRPGLTATVTIDVARRDNALRLPNKVLRFRPTAEMFAALNQPVPARQPGQLETAASTTRRVWAWTTEDQLRPLQVVLGISDGTYTEIVSGAGDSGEQLVSAFTTGRADASTTRSPLTPGSPGMPPPPPPGPPPGGGGPGA